MFLRRFADRLAELGSYTPHEFCIEMSAEHPLVDAKRSRIHPIPAETLSTFVHEYIHYLQNVSTVSGFAGYHATQQLLALFSATVDKTGRSAGSGRLDQQQKDRLTQIVAYLHLLEGAEGSEHVALDAVVQVVTNRLQLPFGVGVALLSEVILTCDVENSHGTHRDEELQLGLCVIEEGLAFEIDRLVAGIDGDPVQDDAPAFPYLVLRSLGEHLIPGIDRRDLIACGVFALLTNDPARCLIESLRDFGQRRAEGASRECALAAVEEATRNARIESIRTIVEDVQGLKQMHANRGVSSTAMDSVGEIFSALLQRRVDDPLWEVRPFLAPELDQDALSELLANVEPCLVLQRLPDDDKDPQDSDRPEHDLMLTFGAPGAATHKMTKRAIPVLQCQVHYVTVHLPDKEFVASSEATGEGASCPFYRSCTLQLRKEHPDTCKTKPWEIYQRSGEETCWYGAAVAGTIGTVKLASDAFRPGDEAQQPK